MRKVGVRGVRPNKASAVSDLFWQLSTKGIMARQNYLETNGRDGLVWAEGKMGD